jgi:hypothetical protein
MNITFQELKDLVSDVRWYIKLDPLLSKYFYNWDKDKASEEDKDFREELKKWFVELWGNDQIAFGANGLNMDEERQVIDTAVIHHSGGESNDTLEMLEILGLIRLYAKEYINKDREYYGEPLWSNHFRGEKQTFIGYHYVIYGDGKFIQTLKDEYIAWHAGNWGVNKRSIAICLAGDFSKSSPSKKALESASKILKKYELKNITPHYEVNDNTICPGKNYKNWSNYLMN